MILCQTLIGHVCLFCQMVVQQMIEPGVVCLRNLSLKFMGFKPLFLIKMQLKHQLDNDTIKNKEAILIVFIDYKQTAIR